MSAALQPTAVIPEDTARAPVSRSRQRRVVVVYVVGLLLGTLPWILDGSPAWRAAGLGMAFPGAGFIAVGGWSIVLVPVALLAFVVALFIWFACGMVLLPPLVWLATAALAGAMAGESPAWSGAPWVVGALLGLWAARKFGKRAKAQQRATNLRQAREAYLPAAMAAVEQRAVAVPVPRSLELSPDDLAHGRLILERSLQSVEDFTHFNKIDQFQTSALRYQINFLGYGLGMMQAQYTPNFHGYLSDAQRRLIDKYLQKRVWDYWRLENLWGKFRYNPDPVGIDNIMLTGYLGEQVGLYMLASGDRRYAEPGSLTFRWSKRRAFAHDIHTINLSIRENFDRSAFCLFPCEPNWIYTGCNFFGLRSLAVYDRLFGTQHFAEVKQRFLQSFDREFTTLSGSAVSLRSSLTGYTAPFPGGDAGAVQAMNLLAPERALRFWAMARNDMGPLLREDNGRRKFKIPGKGLDFGNYGRGFTMIYGGLLMATREIGDAEFSEGLLNALDEDCGRRVEGGVLSYSGSNLANATAFFGRLTQRNGRRDALTVGPTREALRGPVLTQASYPQVLVAKARSHDGEDLELVLYPGAGSGAQSIRVERLQPGRSYAFGPHTASRFTADKSGAANLEVPLDGRTSCYIRPVSSV